MMTWFLLITVSLMFATLQAHRWLALCHCFASIQLTLVSQMRFTDFFQHYPLEFYDLNLTLHPCILSDDFLFLTPLIALCLTLGFPHTDFSSCSKYHQQCYIQDRLL